jgi:hypothetical protein
VDPTVVDPLYDLPAAEFVAARNALAKELRAAGDKASAAVVAKLRRPTATAWALNQIARHQPTLIDEALDARAALLAATQGTGRGDAADLREATAADRAATRAVLGAARELLGGEDAGLSSRITSTLLAAALDPEVAATLVSGRLSAEQDASAFSLGSDPEELAEVIVLADRAPKKAKPKPDPAERAAAEAERERRRRRAEQERVVERAAAKAARLEGKVEDAQAVLDAAREEAEQAAAELAAAQADLDALPTS